jgi:signal transduction histidine kinase
MRGGDTTSTHAQPGQDKPAGAFAGYRETVLGSLTARLNTTRTTRTDNGSVLATGAPPLLTAVRSLVLVMVFITVPLAKPSLGSGPRGIAIAVALGVSAISWGVWMVGGRSPRVIVAALAVMGAAGGVLAGLSPLSTAVAVGCVVTSASGMMLSTTTSLAITAETVAAFLIASLANRAPAEAVLGYPLSFVGLWAFGLTRHAYLLRAVQAERTLAETQRAHAAETQAAALAERARIAREIHDVLAHSLAAVSVNLQAAEGLLAALPDERPELARAIECVNRAGVFTREGLADARRAILALRDDVAPLPDQLAALAREHRTDGEEPVEFTVTGEPRPVGAEAGLAAYRTAQEALTNARKHAAGLPVRCDLDYSATHVTVRIVNKLPAVSGTGPLAATGAGYGLTGLRERAALGGGTLSAGPVDGTWQVCLRIPA